MPGWRHSSSLLGLKDAGQRLPRTEHDLEDTFLGFFVEQSHQPAEISDLVQRNGGVGVGEVSTSPGTQCLPVLSD